MYYLLKELAWILHKETELAIPFVTLAWFYAQGISKLKARCLLNWIGPGEILDTLRRNLMMSPFMLSMEFSSLYGSESEAPIFLLAARQDLLPASKTHPPHVHSLMVFPIFKPVTHLHLISLSTSSRRTYMWTDTE